MAEVEEDFESSAGGASLTYPCQAGALKKNDHVMMHNCPCKINEVSLSKTGKHGHAKMAVVGTDIFTGKRYEDLFLGTHNAEVPNISKVEYQLQTLDEKTGTVSLLLENGDTKDALLTKDEGETQTIISKFKEGKSLVLTVLAAMGQEKIISHKELQA